MANAWTAAGRIGREATDRLRRMLPEAGERATGDECAFPALHWMTAALFLAAGAEAALRPRTRAPGTGSPGDAGAVLATLRGLLRDPLRSTPLLAAPLAGAAHAARALGGVPRARQATRTVDALAAGLAVAGAVDAAYNALGRRRAGPAPSLAAAVAPLTFGATAVLGLILEHEEERERKERERLRRRASVVERLVPGRKPRLDRIVLHI